MSKLYSPSTGLFYAPELFVGRVLPDDVVNVSDKRHAELLDLQAQGRTIAASRDGRPTATAPRAPTLEERREAAHRAVATEAGRRILAIASFARQSNDNALMVTAWITAADISSPEMQAALARRAAIDAIRTASNRLDAAIALMSARQLAALEIGADLHWPKD